jgi:hypothetical protein
VQRYDLLPGLEAHQLRTVLVDTKTQEAVKEAIAVLVLERLNAYLPDATMGTEKSPRVCIESYDRLSRFGTTDRELYVWPFFATGTVYNGKTVFIYKRGYMPVEFPLNRPSGYPDRLAMVPCDPTEGKQALTQLVLAHVSKEEWKDHARKAVEGL